MVGCVRIHIAVKEHPTSKPAAGDCQEKSGEKKPRFQGRFVKGRSHATKAVEGYRSPRRFASEVASERPARVLDCASPLALWPRVPNGRRANHELALPRFHIETHAQPRSTTC